MGNRVRVTPRLFASVIGLALVLVAALVAAIACSQPPEPSGEDQVLALVSRHISPSEIYVRAEGLPVDLVFAPDGRLFFTEKEGAIRIADNGEVSLFYDLEANGFPVFKPGESGLLGIDVREEAGDLWVYVLYTHMPPERERQSDPPRQRILRIRDNDGVGEDVTVVVDDLPIGEAGRHQGGSIEFGPDGMLWVSIGDNLSAEDAQDPTNERGSILRVNPDGTPAEDNPFSGRTYAIGFRNPFAFTFDKDGRPYVADVGPEAPEFDELNLVEPGKNYGWPLHTGPNNDPQFTDPVWSYDGIVTPAGLTFYYSERFSELQGDLFVCENNTGYVRRFAVDADDPTKLTDQGVWGDNCRVNIVEGPDGFLYYSDQNDIRRLVSPRRTTAPSCDPYVAGDAAQPLDTNGRPNLHLNPSAEQNLQYHGSVMRARTERSAEWAFEGSHSVKVIVTEEPSGIAHQGTVADTDEAIAASPEVTYAVTLVATAPDCGLLLLGIREWDSGGNAVRFTTSKGAAVGPTPSRITYVFTTGPQTSGFGVEVRAASPKILPAGFIFFYDDVKVLRVEEGAIDSSDLGR